MKHKVLLANEGCQRKRGEGLGEQFEHALGVLGPTFTLETVHPVHIVRLVIAAIQEEGIGV